MKKTALITLLLLNTFSDVSGQDWSTTGNASTSPGTNFLGTTDAQALVLKTNNAERLRLFSNGNIAIGTSTDYSYKLHLLGNLRLGPYSTNNPTSSWFLKTYSSPGAGQGYYTISPYNLAAGSAPVLMITNYNEGGLYNLGNYDATGLKIDFGGTTSVKGSGIEVNIEGQRNIGVNPIYGVRSTVIQNSGNLGSIYAPIMAYYAKAEADDDLSQPFAFYAEAGDNYFEDKVGIGIAPTTSTTLKLQVVGDSKFNGKLGIGTTDPAYELDVTGVTRVSVGSETAPGIRFGNDATGFYSTTSRISVTAAGIERWRFDGSIFRSASGNITVNSGSANIGMGSAGNITWASGASAGSGSDVGLSRTAAGILKVTDGQASSGTLLSGQMGIGITSLPTGYIFAVGGNMITEKIKVKLQSGWPDFVFEPDYPLMPLPELHQFIRKHRHLPEVPSAEEMEKSDGLDLAEMNLLLLKKVEELTLHMIEADKRIRELEARLQKLSKGQNQ